MSESSFVMEDNWRQRKSLMLIRKRASWENCVSPAQMLLGRLFKPPGFRQQICKIIGFPNDYMTSDWSMFTRLHMYVLVVFKFFSGNSGISKYCSNRKILKLDKEITKAKG